MRTKQIKQLINKSKLSAQEPVTEPIKESNTEPAQANIKQIVNEPKQDTTIQPIKIENRGRHKKYQTQEEAERVAAEQRARAQARYRSQHQQFRTHVNEIQLFILKRLQRIIITDVQDLLLINDIIDRYEIVDPLADPLMIPEIADLHIQN
ncbi:MAG: hypothetical protein EZS28_009678 [Streblomastix strix]|uniref:Uncharacterized protein n=1 Tax=Streblomastix strix TaxID=222440 RepID=A0A5J4WII9_9EUKA|nr:MAG: hypothetical protein EZS28_009678 [Streblomastix strix]